MTEFEWTQLRTLLWKEWRQVRGLFFMVLAILVGGPLYLAWVAGIGQASLVILMTFLQFSLLMGAIGFGVLSYGLEFNENTDQYLATRPLAHSRTFIVKVGLGLVLSMAISFIANSEVAILAHVSNLDVNLALEPDPSLPLWLLSPCIYLAVMTAILAIPPIIPSLIAACLIALAMVAAAMKVGILPLLLAPVFLYLSYRLAYRRVYLAPGR